MEHKKGITGDRNLSMGSADFCLEFTFHMHNTFITWAKTLQLPSGKNVVNIYMVCALISDHLDLTFWVVAYGRFNCKFFFSVNLQLIILILNSPFRGEIVDYFKEPHRHNGHSAY